MSLPEDIENIEDFYRQQLGDLEITPSKDLWGKIETSIQPKPFFSTPAKIGLVSVSVIAIVATVYFWPKGESKEIISADKVPLIIEKSTITKPENKTQIIEQAENKTIKKITKATINNHSINHEEPISIDAKPVEITEPEIISEIQVKEAVPEVAPTIIEEEKPLSYYEKMKKKGKDSLRPIFVPKK